MTQAKNLRRNTWKEDYCSGWPTFIKKRSWNINRPPGQKMMYKKYDSCRKEPGIDKSYYWWNVELTLHFSPCCMYNSGYNSPEENKVKWASLTKEAWSPRVSFLISLSIFLHSLTSSILRISLDSAEAGPRHSFLHSPTLTSIHDYWKNHSFD